MDKTGFPEEPIIPDVSEALAFEPVADPPKQKKRWGRLLTILIVLSVAAGWYFMDGHLPGVLGSKDELPIVRAKNTPVKIRPIKPGGMEVPNRDKQVYDQMEGGSEGAKFERLLDPPETPLTLPTAAPAIITPPPPAPTPVKKKITVINKAPRKLTPVVPTTKDVLSISPPKLAPPPPPAPKVAKVKNKKAAAVKSTKKAKNGAEIGKGFYMVQLAAVRTQDRAQKEWERLSSSHFELLGGLELFVTKVDLGPGKGLFFRLRAGPIASEEASRELCNGLSAKKVGCLIVYP